MKKLLLSLIAAGTLFTARADEGMWIPMLLNKNIAEMQKMGLKLTAEDLYSVNKSSLKDAIVQFGNGCTGEIISDQGLLITNHHCGYGNIAELSTVENNILENGFWAKNHAQEIPAPGLSVKFLTYMQDVTDYVVPNKKFKSEAERTKFIESTIEKIAKDASENGKYLAHVKSYFNGNQYFLLVYEVFNDVRLVATPPKSLGKYGGDTDNWMWPRHTADFAIFRVYADQNNKPANYSPTNKPYTPKHHLPVSLAGVKEKDFTMVMGYPGRTNRYATSFEVDMAINETNPAIVKVRDEKLGIMRKYMRQDPAVNLKLASKYAQIANYWKYYIGQTEQLKRQNVIKTKQIEEKEFLTWAKSNKFNTQVLADIQSAISDYRPYSKSVVYFSEAFYGSNVARLGALAYQLKDELKKGNASTLNTKLTSLAKLRKQLMEDFVYNVELETFSKMTEITFADLPKNQLPSIYADVIHPRFSKDNTVSYEKYAEYVFKNSILLDDKKFQAFIDNPSYDELMNDPAVVYAASFVDNFNKNINPHLTKYNGARTKLSEIYLDGLLKKNSKQLMYPDANSTMRLSYGSIAGYKPKDAVTYDVTTRMEGLLDKYMPGDWEFDLPSDFLTLAQEGNWGQYADENGDLIINFITNNDITGGNSGSPVINDKGELIGLAFDGNWEAMSGDISFDKQYKRTIAVDIRFVLWLVEKYGKADNIIRELDIKR